MSILQSFKKVNLNGAAPFMTISAYGLTFNKTVLEKMSYPDYVSLFADYPNYLLAIQTTDDPTEIPFCISKSNRVNARINNKDFARLLLGLLGTRDEQVSFKAPGVWHPEEKVFVFDLKEAQKIVSPNRTESSN